MTADRGGKAGAQTNPILLGMGMGLGVGSTCMATERCCDRVGAAVGCGGSVVGMER